MKLLGLILVLICAYCLFTGYSPVNHAVSSVPPVMDIRKLQGQPLQDSSNLPGPIPLNKGSLTPVASYEITARILSRANYYSGKESEISPTDLALGWGRMADPAVVKRLAISQSGRFYQYRYEMPPPLPISEIINSSANVHIVPANSDVMARLGRLKEGQVVTLKGYLVNYREEEGTRWWAWKTSLNRSDSGAGACELLYVEYIISPYEG